jgi:chitinase
MKLAKAFVLVAAMLAAPLAMAQTSRMPIYQDGALASGWSNWSWAQVALNAPAGDSAHPSPIRVDAGAWSALYLQHSDFSTSGYSKLTFWVNGGPRGGQNLRVWAVKPGGGGPVSERSHDFRPEANSWTRVEAPLAAIDAANRTVSGFWIQNGTGQAAATFYVTQIALE